MGKKRISMMQMCLTLLFVVSLVVSNIITSKQVLLPFNITMTGAVFIFPITYILSDLFSEVYGYKWSRTTCYLGFLLPLRRQGPHHPPALPGLPRQRRRPQAQDHSGLHPRGHRQRPDHFHPRSGPRRKERRPRRRPAAHHHRPAP